MQGSMMILLKYIVLFVSRKQSEFFIYFILSYFISDGRIHSVF